MVSLYFGLPGSGKTTYLASIGVNEQKRIQQHRSIYKHVYSNFPINYPGIIKISAKDLGTIQIEDGLVLIDEASLVADSRDYKKFSNEMKEFFLLHRHFGVDVVIATQQWDAVDKKIRVITDHVYYVHKGAIRRWISYADIIPYGIIIPDRKDNSDKYGEIIQGYCRGNLFQRFFAKRIRRSRYYKYFDSFDRPQYNPNPMVTWYNSGSTVSASEGSETESDSKD